MMILYYLKTSVVKLISLERRIRGRQMAAFHRRRPVCETEIFSRSSNFRAGVKVPNPVSLGRT
jgi:hypothetical protein